MAGVVLSTGLEYSSEEKVRSFKRGQVTVMPFKFLDNKVKH
jgi:hypothetical protein